MGAFKGAVDVEVQNRCFFFNDTATTEIYPLSLHDALPISIHGAAGNEAYGSAKTALLGLVRALAVGMARHKIRRSEEHTLNSSHANISYAVFCLKKKKTS